MMRGIIATSLIIAGLSYGCVSKSNGADKPVENIVCLNYEDTVTVNTDDSAFVFVNEMPSVKEHCFIVVSKKERLLSVYESRLNDTVLIARFDCCLGKNYGNKQKRGDMRTPESSLHNPFKITSIENSSWWTHDFGDGRGRIKAYGKWFMRLSYGSGIGIHGSTNNENSVPGRQSEGCIRLRDEDIDSLKQHYAFVGMKVIIKGEDEGELEFEKLGS